MKLYLSIILIFFVLNCSSSDQADKNVKRELIKIEKQIMKDTNGDEIFNSFFEFFKKDTLFQSDRTTLPFVSHIELATINAAGEMQAFIETSTNKTDWEFATHACSNRDEIYNDKTDILHHIFYT